MKVLSVCRACAEQLYAALRGFKRCITLVSVLVFTSVSCFIAKMSSRSSQLDTARLSTLEESIVENRPTKVKECIDNGVDLNVLTPTNGVRPLELALEIYNLSIMRLLLEGGAGMEMKNAKGSTALITASRYGCLERVELLVEYGANLHTFDDDEKTCLHAALEQEHFRVAAYLLVQDAHKVSAHLDDLCLLQQLILTDDEILISKLRHCRIDLNVPCPDGTMALFFALRHDKNNSLNGLLKAGANPNLPNTDGNCALHEAVRKRNSRAAKHLISYDADMQISSKDSLTPIEVAVSIKSLSMLKLLLDCGANIEQSCKQGSTPLLAACSAGFRVGVQLLVERGANLKARSEDGRTCLLIAQKRRHQSLVDYLLNQDACNVDEFGRDGFNALHNAAFSNNVDMTRKLLQKQADINIQSHDGQVPVLAATRRGAVEVLQMLLDAGADPNIPTHAGELPLHKAVRRGKIEVVKLLLQHGADKKKEDRKGLTPVEIAMELDPPPEDIIHCLLTDLTGDEDIGTSVPTEDNVDGNKRIFDEEAERNLCCPITHAIMRDPVIAADGHTYEREAITMWISNQSRNQKTSPMTRQPLTSTTLTPNLAIKHLIDQFTNMDSNA